MIPPLAILPILFIVLGLEETAKIALIVIGIAPCIARDLALRVGELPEEQIIKAQTLGASTWQLILRVVLPQTLAAADRLIAAVDGLRLAVPDRRRGDRVHRRAGLSHLSRAPLPRHGRDPALRGVDHAAGVLTDLALRLIAGARLPLGGAGALMATVSPCAMCGRSTARHVVLENVRLEIADHEFVTIVGASGCGKTTFLKMLLGMEQPSRGQILIDGEPIRPEPDPDRGVVFQRYSSVSASDGAART